jgi:pimeloyl-ACP methyl ester carboxylesterase
MKVEHFTGAGGVRLTADVGGDRSGMPVVLLHGGGQTRASWGSTAAKLVDRGCHVIALDARGHGESSWAPTEDGYRLDDFIGDLKVVIATLDQAPALVGASLGGVTSLVAIGESPAAIARALVMVDVTPRINPAGSAAINRFMTGNPDGFASLDEAIVAVAAYLPHRPRPKDGSGLMRNLRRSEDGRLYWHWDPLFLTSAQKHKLADRERMLAAARRVSVPTLLVRGSESEIVTDEAVAEFLVALPAADLAEIPGAHHMVAGDRNDAFSRAVIDFLMRPAPRPISAGRVA